MVFRVQDVEWLTPFWPTASNPGYGSFVSDLWDALRELTGSCCRVHLTSPLSRPVEPADRTLVRRIPATWTGPFAGRVMESMSRRLVRRRIRPFSDLPLHLHGTRAIAEVLQEGSDAPVFLHLHGRPRASVLEELRASAETAQRPLILIPVSEHLSAELSLHEMRGRTVVLPNGYNSRLFFAPAHRVRGSSLRIITVANLEPHKNVSAVIRAVAHLERQGVPAVLRIIGTGSQRQSLNRLAERLGIDARVSFLGARPPGQVAEAMRDSDVFALPSRQEAFGVVFKEARASGLLVIGGAGTGAREAIGADGLLVDPDDPEALARIIADHWSASERGSPANISTPADWVASGRRLLQIYAAAGIRI